MTEADALAEEMENYRLALAYISKQSTDQQSRELAETALNAFQAGRVPQSPTVSIPIDVLWNCGCPSDTRMRIGECQDRGTCGCSVPHTRPLRQSQGE